MPAHDAFPSTAPDDQESTAAPRKLQWLPRWPWLLSLGLLALGIAILSLDETPPEAGDLAIESVTVPDEENGFLLLIKTAADAAHALPLNEADTDLLADIAKGKSWNDAKVTSWIAASEPFLKRYAEAVGKPQSQIPRPTSVTTEIVPFSSLRLLTGLSLAVARKHLRESDPDAAIETALITVRAGKRIQASRGVLISYLIGSVLKNSALGVVEDSARHPNVSTNQLRKTLVELAAAHDTGEDLANSLRSERYFAQLYLEQVKKEGPHAFDFPEIPPSVSHLLVSIPVTFKPNKTLRLYDQQLRGTINLIAMDYPAQTAEGEALKRVLSPHKWSKLNPDNILGRMIVENIGPIWISLNSARLRPESLLSAYEAFVAAQLYQREHGTLPATLDVLVPDYLPAVPKDYFDHAPIRYSAALGVVWSTGKTALNVTSVDQHIDDREVVLWFVDRAPPPKELDSTPGASTPPSPTPTTNP